MSFRLHVVAGPDRGHAFLIPSGRTLLIGRGDEADVQVLDPSVSRVHCRLHVEEDSCHLDDEGSRWGTLVNGPTVESVTLKPGDRITLGETALRLERVASASDSTRVPVQNSPVEVVRFRTATTGSSDHATRDTSEGVSGVTSGLTDLSELVGQTFGDYEVQAVIARARTGMVFRACDATSRQPVALKILWPQLTTQKVVVRRFLRAIRTMVDVRHENLVELNAAGQSDAGLCWMTSEFVDGEDLTQVIERVGISGMLDWTHAFKVALHVARALQVAFDRKIVHRNILPQNILIERRTGVAKLGDLMLARALEGDQAEQVTNPGEYVGELTYLAPETFEESRPVDCRSDLYQLGACIYAVLTGRPPFSGRNTSELLQKIAVDDPEPPSRHQLSVPAMFEDIILQLLRKRPEDRFANPDRLIRDLERLARFQGQESLLS